MRPASIAGPSSMPVTDPPVLRQAAVAGRDGPQGSRRALVDLHGRNGRNTTSRCVRGSQAATASPGSTPARPSSRVLCVERDAGVGSGAHAVSEGRALLQQRANRCRIAHLVVRLSPRWPSRDQAGLYQTSQVLGHRALRQSELFGALSDAQCSSSSRNRSSRTREGSPRAAKTAASCALSTRTTVRGVAVTTVEQRSGLIDHGLGIHGTRGTRRLRVLVVMSCPEHCMGDEAWLVSVRSGRSSHVQARDLRSRGCPDGSGGSSAPKARRTAASLGGVTA